MGLFKPYTLNIRGELYEIDSPKIMGILNVTPDSFYAHTLSPQEARRQGAEMIAQGADIIDVGGCSTRPGYTAPSVKEEIDRVVIGVEAVRSVSASIPVSVDTFRPEVARVALEAGADMVNDVSLLSGGDEMIAVLLDHKAPYVLTHSCEVTEATGNPDEYVAAVLRQLAVKADRLALEGVADVVVDPGFGFSKSFEQNYYIMSRLRAFEILERPLLAGVSRKSMITKACGIEARDALPGTIALQTAAMLAGASIIRVHDVAAARQAVTILNHLQSTSSPL